MNGTNVCLSGGTAQLVSFKMIEPRTRPESGGFDGEMLVELFAEPGRT